jgi:ubiquinone/menaquinone biosynthesis C-methylase UbiE
MPRIGPFETHTKEYEEWFQAHECVYLSELSAVRKFLPEGGLALEVGVGSGRFSGPLGIKIGIEPSREMCKIARDRGIEVVEGVAEELPFGDSIFDVALMVTTICFVDDVDAAFSEVFRILKPNGSLIIGFIDKDSPVGRSYQEHKDESVFYRHASFYSVPEVSQHLKKAGFSNLSYAQTIFRCLPEINAQEPVRDGYGEGSFVVIKAIK